MPKPDFFAQTAEPMTDAEMQKWRDDAFKEIKAKGAKGLMFSVDNALAPTIFLVEGWIKRPRNYPAPHFHVTSEKQPRT